VFTASPPNWRTLATLADVPQLAEYLNPTRAPLPLNPSDREAIVVARKLSGALCVFAHDRDAEPVTTTLQRARHANLRVDEHYLVPIEILSVLAEQAIGSSSTRIVHAASEADRLFLDIFGPCADAGATDVHFDGDANGATVVARVNGEILTPPIRQLTREQHELLARALYVKGEGVLSSDWTPDHYLDASFTISHTGREYRVRYSQRNAHPNTYDVSLRLLPIGVDAVPPGFTALGFADWQVAALEEVLRQPNGMTLLVGEMNSGKSTTLASALTWIRRTFPARRVQTLEHPVEYRLSGVRQSSISERAAKGTGSKVWESALASLMRSDANVLMVGEIRDALSAAYAQELTATGHLFFSTIHAASPIRALQRIVKHGADPAVVFSRGFVRAVIHQRLLQRLCDHCSNPLSPTNVPRALLDGLRAAAPEPINASLANVRVRGDGCPACEGRGITGRTVAASFFTPDKETCKLLLAQRYDDAEELWLSGKSGNPTGHRWVSLLAHGLTKVFAGQVCPMNVDDALGPITRAIHRLPAEMPTELQLVSAL